MQYISNATFAGEVNEAVTHVLFLNATMKFIDIYKLCLIKNNPSLINFFSHQQRIFCPI